jgi:hypothetical protein
LREKQTNTGWYPLLEPLEEVPMLALTAVSGFSRARFRCRFTATGLVCEGIKRRANNGHTNSKSGKKLQQNMVEDVRAAAEIASEKKHSPAMEQLELAAFCLI